MVNERVVSGLPRIAYGLKWFRTGGPRAVRESDTHRGMGDDTASLPGINSRQWSGAQYTFWLLYLGSLI